MHVPLGRGEVQARSLIIVLGRWVALALEQKLNPRDVALGRSLTKFSARPHLVEPERRPLFDQLGGYDSVTFAHRIRERRA